MFCVRIHKAHIVVVISAMLLFQQAAYPQADLTQPNERVVSSTLAAAADIDPCSYNGGATRNVACNQDNVSDELRSLGQHGDKIARARQQALLILQVPNACSAWFQESDPDAAEIFRSLHYELDRQGTSHMVRVRTEFGVSHFKHPWGAMSDENGGRDSNIFLNANGPFFAQQSRVTDSATIIRPTWHRLNVGFYDGDTNEARVTILLHELGHIIGRLPEDNDSWDGRSSRNTLEVLQHCGTEIDRSMRKDSRINN
jgi:hypothetical protein